MTQPKPNIYAALIVKNEAAVIARTIAAAAPYVHAVCIVDTGSTDGTKYAAQMACAEHGLEMFWLDVPWVDYAYNRTVLLEMARFESEGQGHTWMLDADEVCQGAIPWQLNHDGYHICRLLDGFEVWGVRIFSNAKPWVYKNAIHETPDCPGAVVARIHDTWVENKNDGRQGTQDIEAIRERYSREAHKFANLCQADPEDTRSAYYLAQSLKDAGRHGEAFAAYQRRFAMPGGFQEERYLSQLMVARYLRSWQPARDVSEVVQAFMAAVEFRPSRHEAMVELAGYLNERAMGKCEQKTVGLMAFEADPLKYTTPSPEAAPYAMAAMAWAHRAWKLPPSGDLFLVHRPSQNLLPLYELARASHLAGWTVPAAETAKHLLGTCATMSETERATLERIAHAHEQLPR